MAFRLWQWPPPFFLLLTIAGTIVAAMLAHVWYHHPRYGKNTGVRVYPVVGTYIAVLRNRHRILDWVTEWLAASPTMAIRNVRPGGLEFWITANPANVEHILKTNFENYPKGENWQANLSDLLGGGIFNADGEMWKLQRKVASPEFTTRSLRNFMVGSVRDELHGRLIPILAKACGGGPAAVAAVVDLQDLMNRFAFDTICKLGFGVDPACLDAESLPTVKFARAFDTATAVSTQRFFSYPFIWKTLRALGVGPERTLREAMAHINEFAMFVIRTRRQQTSSATNPDPKLDGEHLDLLSRFMGLAADEKEDAAHDRRLAADEQTESPRGDVYSDVFLRDIVISFVLAGRDTSSSGLSWFFWLLTRNRRVDQSIHDELSAILRSRNSISTSDYDHPSFTFEELKRMHYLHAAITESLRLYPPVPIDMKLARAADVWPDGTKITKNTKIAYHPYAMARMERIWGADCREFKPERWINTEGVFVPESPYKFAVFQAGPRTCLGKELAMIQMKMVAAGLLWRFTFSVPAGYSPTYKLSLTLRIDNGLPMTVHPRSPRATLDS